MRTIFDLEENELMELFEIATEYNKYTNPKIDINDQITFIELTVTEWAHGQVYERILEIHNNLDINLYYGENNPATVHNQIELQQRLNRMLNNEVIE